MHDKVELRIGNILIDTFLEYSLDADLYSAADAFSFTMIPPGIKIKRGQLCTVQVNGIRELKGIIDTTEYSYEKSSKVLKVTGRDMMGYLVDCYCEEFGSIENKNVKQLAEQLIKNLTVIKRSDIVYQSGCEIQDTAFKSINVDVEPGSTVYSIISDYAMRRGMMFYSKADGTLIIGKKKSRGKARFNIINKTDGLSNNVCSGRKIETLEQVYSKVVVICQKPTDESAINLDVSAKYEATVDGVAIYKPMVIPISGDEQSPERVAEIAKEKMRAESVQLSYTVVEHSQNGKNWSINEICHVEDDDMDNGIKADYLIVGRTFRKSKETGVTTNVRLGLL